MLKNWRLILAVFIALFFCKSAFCERMPDSASEKKFSISKDLQSVYNLYKKENAGKVADYIPALGKADPEKFGLVVATADGKIFAVGDSEVSFAIESISKVFSLALALEDAGREAIVQNVGVYQTGLPFNSIIASQVRQVKLQNPLVNVGAITTTSFINGHDSAEKWTRTLKRFSCFAGRDLEVNKEVCDSEMATNQGNRALAWSFKSFGFLKGDPTDAVERYTRACSVNITCRDLAVMGACLANGGVNPVTKKRAVSAEFVRDILAIMTISGLYDSSGPWFFRTGLPGKSGVGGGILAVVPGKMAIASFSPPLDEFGNSVRGVKAVEKLSQEWGLHLLD